MKWFKHMTASSDDEKIADLINGGGVEGLAMYGAYWRIAEIIAAQMEGKTPTCSVSYPVWKWTQLLFTRKSHLCSVLTRLKKTGLLVVEGDPTCDSHVVCKMPNLLKYRDEYSKKSGHTPDNIPTRTEVEGEGDKEPELEQKKKKPSRAKKTREGSPTYQVFKGLIFEEWKQWGSPLDEPPWNGAEGKQLGMLIGANPKLGPEGMQRLLRHRAQSEGVNLAARPCKWLPSLTDYAKGPLNQFKQPLTNGGTNGNGHFKGKTEQSLDAAREAIEAIENRRTAGDPGYSAAGEVEQPGLPGVSG